MKQILCLICALPLLLSLSACGSHEADAPQMTEGKYQPLIDKLDAGDYDGARAMIDALEAVRETTPTTEETEPTAQPVTEITQPAEQTSGGTVVADINIVKLTEENAKDYFEVTTQYIFAPNPSFYQAVFLKEEYARKLLSAEKVSVEISYLLSNASGTVDEKGKAFHSDGYEILDATPRTAEISILGAGAASLTQGDYNKKQGYFPDFAVDIEIVNGTGTLIFSE